jgi:hypothetical protein
MSEAMERRVEELERRLRRMQAALATVLIAGAGLVMGAMAMRMGPEIQPEVRTRRLVVVDDKDVARVVVGQDAPDGQRRSRATGITIHDKTGAERGGLSTMDDGSVVMALDAPVGVGAPMRDRIGMVVWPDGSSYFLLIDNETKGVVKLTSQADGKGGLELFKWDDEKGEVHTKRVGFDGETVTTQQRNK